MSAADVRITRRCALLAAALGAGVALVPSWSLARGSAPLTAGRAATYGRLVATLTQAPDGRFCAAGAASATRAFARWYARQDATTRAHIDAVLDGLGAARRDARAGAMPGDDAGVASTPGGYAALSRAAHPAAAPRTAALLAAAVNLAALTCTPPLDEDERPLVPAL